MLLGSRRVFACLVATVVLLNGTICVCGASPRGAVAPAQARVHEATPEAASSRHCHARADRPAAPAPRGPGEDGRPSPCERHHERGCPHCRPAPAQPPEARSGDLGAPALAGLAAAEASPAPASPIEAAASAAFARFSPPGSRDSSLLRLHCALNT